MQGEGLSEPKKLLSEPTGLGGQEEKHTAGVLESWRQRTSGDTVEHISVHECEDMPRGRAKSHRGGREGPGLAWPWEWRSLLLATLGEWTPQHTRQGSQKVQLQQWGSWFSVGALLHTSHVAKAKPERIKLFPNKPTVLQNKVQEELWEHRNTQPPNGKILHVWHQSKISRRRMQQNTFRSEEGLQATEIGSEHTQM